MLTKNWENEPLPPMVNAVVATLNSIFALLNECSLEELSDLAQVLNLAVKLNNEAQDVSEIAKIAACGVFESVQGFIDCRKIVLNRKP